MLATLEVLILRRQLFHWLGVSFPTLRAAITSWYALIANALERQPFLVIHTLTPTFSKRATYFIR